MLKTLWILVCDERGEGTSNHTIIMVVGAVMALAVLKIVGPSLYNFFSHFATCLNGC